MFLARVRRSLGGGASAILARDLGWTLVSQAAIRASRIATIVALSRHFAPETYGVVAVALTVFDFVCVLTRNGIINSVVHAEPGNVEQAARTAYWLTWCVSAGVCLLQLSVAVPVAEFLGSPEAALPIMLLAVTHLANPFCNVQTAFLLREHRMSPITAGSTIQVVADNVASAVLALAGLGIWAVVLPKVAVAPVWVVANRMAHPWRPHGPPTFAGAPAMLRYARGFLGAEAMSTFQSNVDNLLVSFFFGTEALGIYFFAFNAGIGITMGLVSACVAMVYPYLCAARRDMAEFGRRWQHAVAAVGAMVVGLVLLQTTLAPFYVPLVYGQKWVAALPTLVVICLSALPRTASSLASALLRARGETNQDFRWQAGLSAVLTGCLLVSCSVGAWSVPWAVLAAQTAFAIPFYLRATRKAGVAVG